MITRSKRLALGGAALALALGAPFAFAPLASAQDKVVDPGVTPHYGAHGFDASGENTTVKPGDDFFAYANGVYVDHMTIPADRTSYGAFQQLRELSQARTRKILETAAAAHAPLDTNEGKIGAFYGAYMDAARVDGLGAQPLKPNLDAIRAATTRQQLARLMGEANLGFHGSMISVRIDPDDKNPDRYAVFIGQSGLGLPDRDYYLQDKFAAKKAAYQAYIAQTLKMGGWGGDAEAQARAIVDLETQIAQASWSRIERRDPDKIYNPTTIQAVAAADPGFDWATFMTAARLPQVSNVIVGEPAAVQKIAALYGATPVATLQAWQAFHTIDAASAYLSQPFVDAAFDFHLKTLQGQPQLQVRWKRAADVLDRYMGEAVGEEYVKAYFPPESKAKMQQLVENLRQAFQARIQTLTWMTPGTKAEAEKKLAAYNIKIAYPNKWRDYSALKISPTDLYGDVQRSEAFEWMRNVNRLNQPVDKSEWGMNPQTVNAYNYGAIVGVIGHEMTHGFDDEGRKYDSTGRLRDWWTAEDASKFQVRADKLGQQYDTYEPLPGSHVQGKLTMGENIADQGGLSLALDAYHTSLHGKPAPVIDGLTGDQRVFLGWAQVWRAKMRDDARRQQVVTDPHSPEMYRVNGVVRNNAAWYKAFDVKPGDKLYLPPDQRAVVW